MKVNKEEVLKISKLANLNLNDGEIDLYTNNLEDILNFAEIVNEAPIEGLEETIGATETHNVFRQDEVIEYGETQELLQNAPEQEGNMFKIPNVIS
ncbi:MAG: Asp-tRNA(Asn)/Glu-tRNA(Gln) amidotransferase subunit GatC [Oscillospiraceae bacterium]|nr:Asp-tRNA(Asn)/Glu-tRNA(Gln) amidotransferase subunit GatC [Oscillospiraceae bacterium]